MNQLRYFRGLTLDEVMRKPFGTRGTPFFISKDLPPEHEYLWDKVQRERAEHQPEYLGGHYRDIDLERTYHFEVTALIGKNPKNRPAGSTPGKPGGSIHHG